MQIILMHLVVIFKLCTYLFTFIEFIVFYYCKIWRLENNNIKCISQNGFISRKMSNATFILSCFKK